MAIVSHTLETTQQLNGSTHNIVRMFDQDGIEYMVSFFAQAGFDVAARVTGILAAQDVTLADAEAEQVIGGE